MKKLISKYEPNIFVIYINIYILYTLIFLLGGCVAIDLMGRVGLPYPERLLKNYRHELSGGMRQRVMIAMALTCNPRLLIADEPTSSLDSDNRDNFLALLMGLISKRDMTLIFVSHDMALAEHFTRLEALSDITQRPR